MYQIKTARGKNSATIDLNRSFYPLHLVHQAASKFNPVAKVSVKEKQGRIIVIIAPKEDKSAEPALKGNESAEPALKGNEIAESAALHFCNFVLALKREFGEHA